MIQKSVKDFDSRSDFHFTACTDLLLVSNILRSFVYNKTDSKWLRKSIAKSITKECVDLYEQQ